MPPAARPSKVSAAFSRGMKWYWKSWRVVTWAGPWAYLSPMSATASICSGSMRP